MRDVLAWLAWLAYVGGVALIASPDAAAWAVVGWAVGPVARECAGMSDFPYWRPPGHPPTDPFSLPG